MFLDNIKVISSQVFILYVIVAIGFVADKTGVFTRETGRKLTDLLFNIILPIAIIRSFLVMEKTPERIKGLGLTFLLSILTHLVAIGIATLVFRSKKDKMINGLYRYSLVFTNAIFLALPLAQSVIGDEGVFYCSVYVGVFNAFAFTYGVFEMSGHRAKIGMKKIIINPGTISVLIGVPLFLIQPDFPALVMKPLEMVATINSPLAMIVFGTFLAHGKLKRIFTNKKMYLVSGLRLVVIPIIMILIYKVIGITGNMMVALTISAYAPVATNTAMYAGKYDNNTAVASEIVAGSSLISIITIPLIVALVMMF